MKELFQYFYIVVYLVVMVWGTVPASSTSKHQSTYRPPKGKVRHQNRKAGGSRGCNLPLNDTVTLLVPQAHTATTVSARPIFFWYLSRKSSLPLRFTLLEPGKKPLFVKELNPEPGIVALKLPPNSPTLEIGKTYRWTVTVVCNQKKPSRNLFAQAWIERVALPQSNNSGENRADSSFCSVKYAQSGIWYDALACNYAELVKNPHNLNENRHKFWSLLKEIDLEGLAQQQPALRLY